MTSPSDQAAPRQEAASKPERTSRAQRWRGRAVQALILIAVYLGVSAWQRRSTLSTDGPAPSLRGVTLDGRELSLAQLRGKSVLLHFWATWCGVCNLEHGSLNALHARLPENTVLVSVVADGTDRAALAEFVKEHDIRYPVLVADEGAIQRYAVSAFPTNYYLDEAGQIQDVTVGMSTRWAMWLRLWLA
ncbi:MAG TPA: redoxin domain-containing protein [Polyangiaceae bacterium]